MAMVVNSGLKVTSIMFLKYCLVLLVIIMNFKASQSAKLSVPRILLPYNSGIPTNYTLEVREGGCYKWSSSRYDLVSVTPLPSDHERASCTTKAFVSSVSRYPERENAIILAEDEKSGQILRCDVVIDSLHTIEIITTTRVLFLEDAPEAFEVVAKNDQGDTFSSLAGVAFQWSLESDSPASDAYGVLRFLKFADSAYKTPAAVEYWEKQNLHGSMILMEGSKTGSAKVLIKPLDPAYKHVASYDVSLVVVANLNLKPAHIYVLPGSKVHYQLELIKQGKAFPISLPSDQYYLEVEEGSVASLEGSFVTSLKFGSTHVVVKDKYISGREVAYLPSAIIHVVPPSYLTLSVSPGDKWILEEKKHYSVTISLYDRNSHPIHITEEVQVSAVFPPQFFQVEKTSGKHYQVQTLAPGSCVVSAKLLGVTLKGGATKELETTVQASQDVIIYESIRVHPSHTLLAWDPVEKPLYTFFLKATGGTGTYNWKSGDSSIGSVNALFEGEETIARVATFGSGSFKVHAVDAHIPAFAGYGEVSVQPVVELEILPDEVEVEINKTLILPVAMYGLLKDNSTKMFSNCSEVPVVADIDESPKFQLLKGITSQVKSKACRNVHLKCVSDGFNRVRVRYEREEVSLRKALIVGCFKKLKVVSPSKEVVLALGSSSEILLEGGPKPWPRCASHFVTLEPENDLEVYLAKKESFLLDTHKVNAFCRDYGENSFTLKVGNRPCATNLLPAVNQASVKVFCAVPESIFLKPILSSVQSRKCPATGDRIAVHNRHAFKLEVVVKDSAGREFNNISSLDVQWQVSDSDLATLLPYKGSLHYQELKPFGLDGTLRVTASIAGYLPSLAHTINDEDKWQPINASLQFVLVQEAQVEPKKVSVFNSPSTKVYLNVTKGSGYFEVKYSDASKAEVLYNSGTQQIEVTPLETGSVIITLIDLCLGVEHQAVAEIEIYGISAIVVDVLDKVQLGDSITAVVEVLSEDSQRIPASVFALMNLQAVSVSNIVSIKLASEPEPHQFQALFSISGLSLGQTTFRIVTRGNIFKGVQYSSDTYPIQVFSPLKVDPSHIVLIVGATFQVLCSGGPTPQTNIEYSVDEKDIATVSEAGIVEAKKVGKSTLSARSVGLDTNGKSVVFSEYKVMVSCISLKEIKIHSPLSRMVVGSEIPLYAMGPNELENPFAFGTALPAAHFKWSVSNDKVASLQSIYQTVGLQESSENNFRASLKALQDGLVTVYLEVTFPQTLRGTSRVLTSEIQIQIFKRLRLTNPEVEDGMILMSLNSQLKLKCNRFGAAKVSFKIPPAVSQSASVVNLDEKGNLVAGSKMGSSVLLVTAVEEFGITQHLSVIVEVEEVAYIMLKPSSKILTKDWTLTALPVGFVVSYQVSHHNSIGQVFDAIKPQLQYRASRHNSARVSFANDNTTLSVQVVKPGFTVLKVWDTESPIRADFIRMSTGIAIDPSEVEVTVGDIVCFDSPLVTREGHSGTWSSSQNSLAIHPVSGGAVALGPGQTVVSYSLLNGYTTSTQVTIQDAAYISMEPGSVNQISNLPRNKPYKIFIVVQGNETNKINNIIGRNCSQESLPLPVVQAPFSCVLNFISSTTDVSANNLFHTATGFDMERGMYYCSIMPLDKISLLEASILEGDVSLTVHLPSMGPSAGLSQQVLLSFLPAFHVQQEAIVLSEMQKITRISVSASSAVQKCLMVVPSDASVVRVLPPERNSYYTSSLHFPIELHDVWKEGEVYVEISCPLTQQKVRVPIRIKRQEMAFEGGAYCAPMLSKTEELYDWYLISKIVCVIFGILIVFFAYKCATSTRRGVVTSQPVFLHTSPTNGHKFSSPGRVQLTPSPLRRRYSPHFEEYDSLSQPLRLCRLETSPRQRDDR